MPPSGDVLWLVYLSKDAVFTQKKKKKNTQMFNSAMHCLGPSEMEETGYSNHHK